MPKSPELPKNPKWKSKPFTTEDTKEHGGRIAVIADIARDRRNRKNRLAANGREWTRIRKTTFNTEDAEDTEENGGQDRVEDE